MINVTENKNATDLICLATCGLHNVDAGDRVNEMNLEEIAKLASDESMSAITYVAVENSPYAEEFAQKNKSVNEWKQKKWNALRHLMVYKSEQKKLEDYLEENEIWFTPLKGSVIKKLYPSEWMREMNDTDILFDYSKADIVEKYFAENGYTKIGEATEWKNSDEYVKKPFLYFEMHKMLMDEKTNPVQAKYYANIKEKLICEENFKYRMSDEETYIYMIIHAMKHFEYSGMGLRFLMDVYVFLNKKENSLNWDYIRKILKNLNATRFEKDLRELSKKTFDDKTEIKDSDLPAGEKLILDHVLLAKTFGTKSSLVKSQVYKWSENEKINKKDYIKKRLFPDDDWYRKQQPFVYKHKWLKPFYVIYRASKGFKKNKEIKKELKEIDK